MAQPGVARGGRLLPRMVTPPATRVPYVATDLAHGGRWTSLRLRGREWLWARDEPRRDSARPGEAFADAGGLEECIPTVRGTPDHGAAWTRRWRHENGADVVDCDDFVLRRRIRTDALGVSASYRLEAASGFRFIWAAHALLELSPAARLKLPHGTPTRVYSDAASPYLVGAWPAPLGLPLDRLGPDDGTAVGAVAVGCAGVRVVDGADELEMSIDADVVTSVALWRNLGGFPAGAPYRSIGVEPMLGSVFDLDQADEPDAVTVPASGSVAWRLDISAAGAR